MSHGARVWGGTEPKAKPETVKCKPKPRIRFDVEAVVDGARAVSIGEELDECSLGGPGGERAKRRVLHPICAAAVGRGVSAARRARQELGQ